MRIAIIGDVHANLPAAEATLDAVSRAGVDRTVSVGDLVGYNAEPAACLDLVRGRVNTFVAGNHDLDVAREEVSPGTSTMARDVQDWTRRQLDKEAISFLVSQPAFVSDSSGFVAVHGCYLNPPLYSGYLTSTMLERNLRTIADHADWPKVALCGHTHVPLLAWLDGGLAVEARATGSAAWPRSADAILLNPGSVGQPRDGDPRASFIILDLEKRTAAFERVSYDIERACRAITAAHLPACLAERLREGR